MEAKWKKATRSAGANNCVEVALDPALARVRDTKNRAGEQLTVPASGWSAFIDELKRDRSTH